MLRAIVVLLIATLLSSAVHAQQRIALLIGNQAYNASVGPLKNPHNDISVVGSAWTTSCTESGRRVIRGGSGPTIGVA
jgi:hypothetical protein